MNESMRAAVLVDTRSMVCRETPVPDLQTGEVLVKVAYCGVCGSDVPRFLDGAVHRFPLVLGHEFSGTVVRVADSENAHLLGKRVAGVPLMPCGKCEDCRRGNYSLCGNYSFIGSRRDGAFAEYVAIPAQNAFPLPDAVDDLQGAFFEPATVAEHAIMLAGVTEGATAAVMGCGTIGILLAQALQARGVSVSGFARREVRMRAARSAGVQTLVDTSTEGWLQEARESQSKGGFDFVFDTSGNGQLMVNSLEVAANKGVVCMVGTPKRPMEFSVKEWENVNRKELVVMGAWMSYSAPFPGSEWVHVAQAFANGKMRVTDEMIDSVYTLEEIPDGMLKFAQANTVQGKMVVNCD